MHRGALFSSALVLGVACRKAPAEARPDPPVVASSVVASAPASAPASSPSIAASIAPVVSVSASSSAPRPDFAKLRRPLTRLEKEVSRTEGEVSVSLSYPVYVHPNKVADAKLFAAFKGAHSPVFASRTGMAGSVHLHCTSTVGTLGLVGFACDHLVSVLTKKEVASGTGGAPGRSTYTALTFVIDGDEVRTAQLSDLVRTDAASRAVLAKAIGQACADQAEADKSAPVFVIPANDPLLDSFAVGVDGVLFLPINAADEATATAALEHCREARVPWSALKPILAVDGIAERMTKAAPAPSP